LSGTPRAGRTPDALYAQKIKIDVAELSQHDAVLKIIDGGISAAREGNDPIMTERKKVRTPLGFVRARVVTRIIRFEVGVRGRKRPASVP